MKIIQYKKWPDVPKYLKSKTYFKKERLILPKNINAQVYQKTTNEYIGLYDIRGAAVKPTLTDKQIMAIRKARDIAMQNRTCKMCNTIFSHKTYLNKDGYCETCEETLYYEKKADVAWERREYWHKSKNIFCICDTETTGLGENDEIVEIAIIDLDGNTLYESLIKPIKPIPKEISEINGITNQMLIEAPAWKDAWEDIKPIILDRTIIAFNADFDERMIKQSCIKWGIETDPIKTECLMKNVMAVCHMNKRISLKNAANVYIQDHRAIGDCLLCLSIINEQRHIS